MSRYSFLSALVSCFVFSCGNVPIKTSSIPENLSAEIGEKQPPKNTWQWIKQLSELPDDCFNNAKEDKDKLIKMLPQTEEEFKDKNFASKRHEIYRKALKLYGAIAYNLQEKNKQLQAKCDQLQAKCDQPGKNNQLTEEKVRSLLVKQKNNHQLELNKKNEIIKNLEDEIQALKSSPNFQPN